MIVVDSNVAAYCWILGDRTAIAQRIRLLDPEWHAPVLWRSEMRNTLLGYVRRGVVDIERASMLMTLAEEAFAGGEHEIPSGEALSIALQSGLSAYDAEFVVLARSLAVPLVTEDRAILNAFPGIAISMKDFLDARGVSTPSAHQARAVYRGKRGRKAKTPAV